MFVPFTEAVVVKAPAPLLFLVGVHRISQHGVLLLLLLFYFFLTFLFQKTQKGQMRALPS